MEVVNNVLEYFGVAGLSEQATFQDFMVYGISVFIGIYIFVCLYRGIVTMCTVVGKDW